MPTRALRPASTSRRNTSFAHLPPGQLEEEVLQVRAPMHEAQARLPAQVLDRAMGLAQVAEGGLAVQLRAIAQRLALRLEPRLHPVAVHLDHFRLDVLGDELPRRALGERAAVVDDLQAIAQALGLVHEMRGEEDRLALAQEQAQLLPHAVERLR